jgi:hypothetical protein
LDDILAPILLFSLHFIAFTGRKVLQCLDFKSIKLLLLLLLSNQSTQVIKCMLYCSLDVKQQSIKQFFQLDEAALILISK